MYGTMSIQESLHLILDTQAHTHTQIVSAGFISTSGKVTEGRTSTLKAKDLRNYS